MKRTVELPHDPVDSRQFALAVKLLADSLSFGPDDSIYHGSGLEYSQSRAYQPGDSIKLIDRASATIDKAVEKAGLTAIHWALGENAVITHFRFSNPVVREEFEKDVLQLIGAQIG